MLVNQTLLYLISNINNNIRVKSFKNSFNAVWKKVAQGFPLSPDCSKIINNNNNNNSNNNNNK